MITTNLFTRSLRHKVLLQQQTRVEDGAGGFETAWETVAVLWAAIEHKRGVEAMSGGKITSKTMVLFRLRYYANITTGMRFMFQERIFNIRSIHNKGEQNRILEIVAEEGVAV